MKRFVIFSLGRSGSHLLAALIGSPPTVHCDGELFNSDRWPSRIHRGLLRVYRRHPMWYVSLRERSVRCRLRPSCYGFMLKPGELDRPASFFRQLTEAEWRIFHLHRESVFAQTISHFVAQRSGRWRSRPDDPDPEIGRLSIAPNDFLQLYANKRRRIRECHDLMQHLPHMSLTYERDLESSDQWQATVSRVYDHLRMPAPSLPAAITLRRTWRQPYSELVANYDELLALARRRGNPFDADLVPPAP